MSFSVPSVDAADLQLGFWNKWNAETRERGLCERSLRQREVILAWLRELQLRDADLIEVGCGAGWLLPDLLQFGAVTGTDLADEVVHRAQQRVPQAKLVAGNFMELDFAEAAYDVVISCEVLSHVPDQAAFIGRLARLLKPGGHLMLATQNRPILERNRIPPPAPGQLRRWVDQSELRALLAPSFEVTQMFVVTPICNCGILRLVTSCKLRRVMRLIAGRTYETLLERLGLGWTVMALARKAGPAAAA